MNHDIERALVVANEYSSHAGRMRRQVDELEIPIAIVPTERDPRRTQEALFDAVRDGDVVLGAGGDGTTNQVANILLGPEGQEQGLYRLPFIPLRGGNANDIASMLNGRKTAAQILRLGRDTYLHPLEIHTDDPEERVRLALGYFSVGATAAASQRLEEVKGSANAFTRGVGFQLVREAVAVWLTTARSEAFKLERDGMATESATDFLTLRGDRIAKLGRPHADLRAPEFESVTSDVGGLAPTLAQLIRMQRGRLHGSLQDHTGFSISSGNGQPLPVQYDGETDTVQSGSHLSVSISPVTYRTLSTKL